MNDTSAQIRSVCVYCGSSPGKNPAFATAATELGTALADHGIRLIYGGGDNGLMGSVASATLSSGGEVCGIIPEFLQNLEQPNLASKLDGAEMIIVPDMHTRKQMMFEKADAFVAMPGGIGTLEELVEVSTWAQLGRHAKPIILLNIDEFWSPYLELVDHMAEAGFLHNPQRAKPIMLDAASKIVPTLLASSV